MIERVPRASPEPDRQAHVMLDAHRQAAPDERHAYNRVYATSSPHSHLGTHEIPGLAVLHQVHLSEGSLTEYLDRLIFLHPPGRYKRCSSSSSSSASRSPLRPDSPPRRRLPFFLSRTIRAGFSSAPQHAARDPVVFLFLSALRVGGGVEVEGL